jgi:three-Cys-motif partner protein
MDAAATNRNAADRAARGVVRDFLAEWARRTARAIRGEAAADAHVAVVVGFAGSGHRPGIAPADAFASCLAATRVLGGLEAARRSAILVEPDPVLAERLADFLDNGLGAEVRLTGDCDALEAGTFTVLNASFAEAVGAIGRLTADPARCLYLLDPPAPGDLPLAALRPLLAQPRADFLITLPASELDRQAQHAGVPLADLPPRARRSVDGYAALCGDVRYEWLLCWRAATSAGEDAEAAVAEHYRARLEAAAGSASVKHVALHPADAPAGAAQLLLATREPALALDLNRAVRAARLAGHVAWGEGESLFVAEYDPGVLDLFGAATGAPPARERRVDHAALAAALASRHAGECIAFARVLAEFIHTELFVEDVRRALALRKRERRARYGVLTDEAEIAFAAAGEAFDRRATGRHRERHVGAGPEKTIDLPGLEGPAGR